MPVNITAKPEKAKTGTRCKSSTTSITPSRTHKHDASQHSEWAPRSPQAGEVDLYSTKGAAARLHTTVPNGTAAQNKQARTEMDEPEGVQAASGGEPSCEEPQL